MHDLPPSPPTALPVGPPPSSFPADAGSFARVKLFDLCHAPESLRGTAPELAGREVTPLDEPLVWEVTIGRYCWINDPLQDAMEAALAAQERALHAWLRRNGGEEGETVLVRAEPC